MFDRDVEDTKYMGFYRYCPYCELDDAIWHSEDDTMCVDCREEALNETM